MTASTVWIREISGRAVDEHGAPLAQHRMRLGLASPPGWRLVADEIPADEHGRFRVTLQAPEQRLPLLAGAPVVVLELDAVPEVPGRPPANALHARIELPAAAAAGIDDVGDVTFRGPTLVAAGHVVDDWGRPLAGVRLRASIPSRLGPFRSLAWLPIERAVAVTAEDGSFALTGDLPQLRDDARVRLAAALASHHQSEPVIVEAGDRAARVVLHPAGSVDGTLLVPHDVGLDELTLRLRRHAPGPLGLAPGTPALLLRATLDPLGRFHFPNVPPEPTAVEVLVAATGEPLKLVAPVHVPAGEAPWDPRLSPIDLRKGVHALTLRLLDATARPVPGATALLARSSDGPPRRLASASDARGRLRIVTAPEPIDLLLRADGFRETLLDGLTSDTTVTLKELIPVRVALTGGWSWPDAPLEIAVQLFRTAASSLAASPWERPAKRATTRAVAAPERSATFPLHEPGPYGIRILLRRAGASAGPALALHSDVLDVLDTTSEQVFLVPLAQERILAASELLR